MDARWPDQPRGILRPGLTGLAGKAPWLLQTRLREAGANFSSSEPWAPFVVVDDKLVTGQNPASSTESAKKVVELLKS